MTSTQSPDPRDRMGIYKQLSDVPPARRFERYSDLYRNVDTYSEFLQTHYSERISSERAMKDARLAGRRWKRHMEQRGRHHALATPVDVEVWMSNLLDKVSMNTAYNVYWVKLEYFYWWLQRRIDHPHSYHPFLMAAAQHPAAGNVWEKKLGRWRGDS